VGRDETVTRVIAGVGCRLGSDADAVLAVLADACARAGCVASALATPVFKAREAGVQEAARRLGVPLILVEPEALEAVQSRCVTRSARVAAATGMASVSEASALAAAGPGGRLLLARVADRGVTCALAETVAT
jgi:cobalt-precorrin 5A hydrolase